MAALRRSPLERAMPWAAVTLLAAFLATQYGYALQVPFLNDDYVFLDKTRSASFGSLWGFRDLAFHWYRPWSRELHYWLLQRVFGFREPMFHAVSWALWLAVLSGYFWLVHRLAGMTAACVAAAGVAALAAWGVPIVWIAGVQDLWLLAFTVAFFHAVVSDSRALAIVWLLLGLLSKESAAVLPALAVAYACIVERRSLAHALRRSWPLWLAVGMWAAIHPLLGGRLWRPLEASVESGLHPPFASVALRTLGVPINLDALPRPESGWIRLAGPFVLGAALLAALMVLGWRVGRRSVPVQPATPGSSRRISCFGLVWAALGWAPVLAPSLGWHSYYALLGALGIWLAIAPALARAPWLALGVVSLLALLRVARADTPSRDWGTEWYQRRAGSFIHYMRSDLMRQLPTVPSGSRFFFVRVPSNVGFLAGDGPALRIWYRDSTLRGGYYPAYRRRAVGDSAPDFFFRFDSLAGWVRVTTGAEDVPAAQARDPHWSADHARLAETLARAENWPAALEEYEKLAAAEPASPLFAYDAALCHEALGDSVEAARWYRRAAALPGADAEMKAAAQAFDRLRPSSRR